MLGWLKSLKAKKADKIAGDNMFRLVKEIKETKTRLDDYMWLMQQYHADVLPEQTDKFATAAEFNLTSLISCYGIAVDKKRNKIIKEKIDELRQQTQ